VAAARVTVLGAGSIGCFVGGAWQAAGLPVTFMGRPSIGDAIAGNGLKLTDYAGWEADFAPHDVDYSIDAARLADAEIIAVCVKSGATADAAREIAEHGRDGALVISFQNGVSNVDVLEGELGGRFEVARGMVRFNVVQLGPGHFHKAVAGDLYAEDLLRTRTLAAQIASGPAELRLSDDMVALAWGKLLINLNNAVSALSGRTLVEELSQRDYRRVFAASMREGIRLLRRAGIRPAQVGPAPPRILPKIIGAPDILFRNFFAKKWKIDAKARSSMADDLAARRKTEVDYLNGELVRLAETLGRDAPVNRAIVRLVHEAEAGAKPLGPAALRRAVLGR
jgi:2-dehydropantoate 2-reductase